MNKNVNKNLDKLKKIIKMTKITKLLSFDLKLIWHGLMQFIKT